ncbi:MAG: hypothetical protein H6825_13560 [Planctomycetes bacterium]|nr:hypothetical protein [Planctomycetota bacterium]
MQSIEGRTRARFLTRGSTLGVALSFALCFGAPSASALDDSSSDTLVEEAAKLKFRMGRKDVEGSKVERDLLPSVRAALNTWAATAGGLGFEVAVPEHAPAIVLGRADDDLVHRAAQVLDDAWEVLERALPDDRLHVPATVAVLFDEPGMRSDAYGAALDLLVARRLLRAEDASRMRDDPGGLTMRGAPVFLQPTWDMAGNAAAGDDEFRLDNEVAAKFTQCVLTKSFGQLPKSLLWGMSFLVEQRLFGTSYAFDASGFVSSSAHFDWGKRTAELFDGNKKDKDFSVVPLVLEGRAGVAEPEQMMVWGALDFVWSKRPADLGALFEALADLQADADPYGGRPDYVGEPDATEAALAAVFGELAPKDLAKHVKRLK